MEAGAVIRDLLSRAEIKLVDRFTVVRVTKCVNDCYRETTPPNLNTLDVINNLRAILASAALTDC